MSQVGLVRCDVRAGAAAVEAQVAAAIELAGGLPARLRTARSILVKPNFVGSNGRFSHAEIKRHVPTGKPVGDTDPLVTRAVVRLLRAANPSARLLIAEGVDTKPGISAAQVFAWNEADQLVDECGAELLDANDGELLTVPVPGGLINRTLVVRREVVEAEAVVSVAKLKVHGTAGITLGIKNLFGLLPRRAYGSTHRNFVHTNYYRLMRTLVDTALVIRPDLVVIDGLIASNRSIVGDPVEMGLLLAGADPVATDATGMRLMSFNPLADFPTMPFLVAENHLRLAASAGLGELDPARIAVRGEEVTALARPGFFIETEGGVTTAQAAASRQAAIEQAAIFQQRRAEFERAYAGQYIFLRNGRVERATASLAEMSEWASRQMAQDVFGLALKVEPAPAAAERVEAYV